MRKLPLFTILLSVLIVACTTEKTPTKLSDAIRINQIGFYPNSVKQFVVADIEELDEEKYDNLTIPDVIESYGGKSLHEQSHGESFMSLVVNRFFGHGLYILDEPEAALSPTRQLTLLARMNQLCKSKSQFIIATHSPIILAYPDAEIYQVTSNGLELTNYEDTEHYAITKSFLLNPERMLNELFKDE